MRNVIYAINITLDGCCDHTPVNPDDEILEYFTDLTREVDLQVFGRKTYQLMVPYWPEVAQDPSASKADQEFARAFNSTRKDCLFPIVGQHRRWKYQDCPHKSSRRNT